MGIANAADSVRRSAEGVVASEAFVWASRAGFVARAIVYGLIGLLPLKLALGIGGKTTNQQGALETIAARPFGHLLLALVATGLGGYACWRLVRAVLGHGPEGSDRPIDRAAGAASGLVYAALFAVALSIILGRGSAGSGGAKPAAAGVMGWPGGVVVVGLGGGVLILVGLYQFYLAVTGEFFRYSKTEEMSQSLRRWFKLLGAFGYGARGVVFEMVGLFLLKAAIDFNPHKAVGLDGVLQKLAASAHGPLLLGVVAAGLIAFGCYSLADARYRKI